MAISSPGIGSGLDVKSIISQLMALEQKPLQQLQTTAQSLQTKLSAFGQLKSQMANLQDQVAKLTSNSTWSSMTASSSNSAAVTATVTSNATSGSISVAVSQLANAQTTASGVVASNTTMGGTLTFGIGEWQSGDWDNNTNTADTLRFTEKTSSTPVHVNISDGDTLAQIATKINDAQAGVTASVMTDASGSRLVLRSNDTGSATGFRVQASGLTAGSQLASLAYDPENNTSGTTLTQAGTNTQATINGISVTSANNQFNDVLEGVKITVAQTTTSTTTLTVSRDTSVAKTAISNLVESYNAISKALAEMTKYDAATKTAGSLQGDGTAVGLESALRRIMTGLGGSNNSFKRLSDIGVSMQLDGTLAMDATKLGNALQKSDDLKSFFTASPSSTNATQGLAIQLKSFAQGLLDATSGTLISKNKALQADIARNTKDQDRISDRIARTEARLTAQYSRLDSTLGKLTALNNYVAQQVTTWNNQNNN